MDMGLAGKTAIVSGGSQGIGKAVAIRLAEEGVRVAICSRRQEALAETATQVKKATGHDILPLAADLTKLADVQKLVRQVADKFGSIQILVNCAASPVLGKFLELSDEAWQNVLDTKYFGYIRCIREVLPYMIKQKDGRIVSISGISGVTANPMYLPGGSVNAALNIITKGLALDMSKYNIRVNAVMPGLVGTERFVHLTEVMTAEKKATKEAVTKGYSDQIPLGRVADPREIADLVVYLVSDRSSYITGDCLTVDGGRSLAYSTTPSVKPKAD